MPANDTYWRNLKTMHVVFVVSAIGLFAVTLGMMWVDHADEWRPYQSAFDRIEARRLDLQIQADMTDAYNDHVSELEEKLREAKLEYANEKGDIEEEIAEIQYQLDLATRRLRERRAFRDKARADYDLAVRDGKTDLANRRKAEFDDRQEAVQEQDIEVQQLTTQLNEVKQRQQAKLDRVTAIETELAAAKKEIERLEKTRQRIAPKSGLAYYKRKIMQWPIIDGFNSPHQIQQVWLPDLKITLGMAQTARFDRCQTCHRGIDRVETGNIPSFPHGADPPTHRPTEKDIKKWVGENKYPHPYSTHPNPDLYLTSTSPHPVQDFGCTICHDGQGSGTSFDNVQHSPNDPHEREHWAKKYHYHFNHFWEYPMQPERFRESSCLKCHHSVVELETSPQFGNSAPKLVKGFHTIQQFGCFGCHEIHGKDGAKPIGPDLRLEPNHFAVAQAIAAAAETQESSERAAGRLQQIQTLARQVADAPEDTPDQRQTLLQLVLADRGLEQPLFDSRIHALAEDLKDVENPGQYRKVGPSLRHVETKATQGWLEHWTNRPKDFRPDTRMPQFFHLTNQEDELAGAYQPVQVAAISHFLLQKSQPVDLLSPPDDYEPNAERGKTLFAERGCLSCHSHKDFPAIENDFGPSLDRVYAKLKPGDEGYQWLYSWIRDPQRYHKRSKMPNLYLDQYQAEAEGEENGEQVTVDPAADIAAYLLQERETDQPKYSPYNVKDASLQGQNVLDELVGLYLAQSLTKAQMEKLAETRIYPYQAEQIKGDEIELIHRGSGAPSETEWQSMKLNYVGRRTISQYGCYGCHDIPEFESAKPIGVALQDWGRKDTSRLAFEHITEFLHHHNTPGADSTLTQQVDQAMKRAKAEEFRSEEEAKEGLTKAFYLDSLLHHGRPGFIWQKLRQPRSYDYEKIGTKGYDERLNMPQFPFDNEQIEAVATFVLGMTAEPPAEKYLFQPQPATQTRYEGEALLTKYNCTSCHMVELPEVMTSIKPRQAREDTVYWFVENRDKLIEGELARSDFEPYYRQLDDQTKRHAGLSLGALAEQAKDQTDSEEAFEAYLNQWFDEHPETLAATYADFSNVGMTLDQILDWFVENRNGLIDGSLGVYPDEITKIQELCELFGLNIDVRGIANLANVAPGNSQRRLSPEESTRRYRTNLQQWFANHPETLLTDVETFKNPKLGKLPEGVRALFKIKPPHSGETNHLSPEGNPVVRFHGMGAYIEDLEGYSYDLWETLSVGGRILLPTAKILFDPEDVVEIHPGRGGLFTEWLVARLSRGQFDQISKARQSSPPPLVWQGLKVQTPWLYNFLKNPERIRYETVLRMPRFNMSDAEALALANYFAAVDGAEYPYQDIPQRSSAYVAEKNRDYQENFEEEAKEQPAYLARSWKMLGKYGACRQCHSVAGDEFKVLDPTQVTHGPDLDTRVADRFRADYLDAWLHSPQWILPYTGMAGPTSAPLEGYFNQNPNVQVEGLRDAILHFNQLLQSEGKIEPPPPVAPMQDEPAETE